MDSSPGDDTIVRRPTTSEAERLRSRLRATGYEESAVCQRLGIGSVVAVEPLHAPSYLLRLGRGDPQAALIRLFLLQRAVPAAELRPAWGAGDMELLIELGLAERRDELLTPRVDLYPYGEDWLATDRSDRAGEGSPGGRFDAVMPLNMSSHTLAQIVLPIRVDTALDIGTGCGVHAIRAARRARRVIATDLNPRALHFAAFNTALNGVENVELRMGDLWEPVAGERFDLVVANPAFSLSSATDYLFRDGGARGDRMTRALLSRAVDYLAEGGLAQVIGEFPTIGESGFEEQVEEWVGESGCDVLLLRFGAMDPLEYAVAYAHQPFAQSPADYEATLTARLRDLDSLGVRDIVLGAVILRRPPPGAPQRWAARRVLPAPERAVGCELVELIRDLDRGAEEETTTRLWSSRPRMAAGLRLTHTQVWHEDRWEEEGARVSASGNPFCPDLQLSGPARDLLTLCDGRRRGNEIAAEFARIHHLSDEEAAEATLAFLRELEMQGLISVDGAGKGDRIAEAAGSEPGRPE